MISLNHRQPKLQQSRAQVLAIGRRWAVSLTELVTLAVELDESGAWALDGSPTCSHWIASALDVEVCTARGWLRVGLALRKLPLTAAAFVSGAVSFTTARALTKIATAENEAELLEIADRTPAGRLGVALAAWSARHEDEDTRDRRHRRERSMRSSTSPDGMVQVNLNLTPNSLPACCRRSMRRSCAGTVASRSRSPRVVPA